METRAEDLDGEGDWDLSLAEKMEPDVDPVTGKHRCRLCDNITATRQSFNSHRRRKHGTIRNTLICPVDSSCAKSPSADALRLHLNKAHGVSEEIETRSFESKEDFVNWKEQLQKATNAQFVRRTVIGKTATENYYCNRAGEDRVLQKTDKENESSSAQRAPRNKGSVRSGVHCPATISVKHMPDGTVKATNFLKHIGHGEDVCFVNLSATAREIIKTKLREGFAPDRIADFVRKEQNVSLRDRQIRSKDVCNILRHDLPELIGYFDKDDHISVDCAVKHYDAKHGADSPVFYYRPRTIANDSFTLGLQTRAQRDLLDRYSGNVVCLDTTHKVCHYEGYLLGTLMILDSTGAGQPVAWFLVKGESEAQMTPVFKALKERHPDLRPKYFMSDCADAFWNAWRTVFDVTSVSRLLCLWHVWRAWSAHIARVSEERRRELREMLKNLVAAPTKHDFDLLYFAYSQAMSHAGYTMTSAKEKAPKTFGAYFHSEYVVNDRSTLWARYGRVECDISTNMHLESFHRTLKKRYLQRVCNRRIDYVLHTLVMKVAPDFTSQLQRSILMRGQSSTFQQRVSFDHHKSAYLLDNSTTMIELGEGTWKVPSSTGNGEYIVKRLNNGCEPDICHIKCRSCHVCPHQYMCNCPRYAVGGRMPCKHVHAVHVLYDRPTGVESDDDDDIEIDVELLPEPELPQPFSLECESPISMSIDTEEDCRTEEDSLAHSFNDQISSITHQLTVITLNFMSG
uniref:SWIM-type domain-containing protein n=1 Tax=Plectus sambesii TaxID=2011161 RepID=A0A914W128_9BILA